MSLRFSMNKQELLNLADYNFQRGNRELAKKYLVELLTLHPEDEPAWMLLARVVEERERQVECYRKVLKINPGNNEAKIALARLESKTQPLLVSTYQQQKAAAAKAPARNVLRVVMIAVAVLIGLGATTFAIASRNPQSNMAKLIIPASPTPYTQTLAGDVAPQTRADIVKKYPEYAPLVDTLISFAISNAESGMVGAPERPGAEIMPSDTAASQAKEAFESALPQPGTLNTATLSEEQITSWLAVEMRNSPDLPLQDVQVYLRDGKIQIWGVVKGSADSTSALMVGSVSLDANGLPGFEIESMQIGQQVIPDVLVTQAESWLNQMLLDEINRQVPGLRIMNINISSGMITVAGMR